MTRTVLLAALAAAAPAAAAAGPPAGRPNVVVVVSDDQGWRDAGYRGNPVAKTPHLDDLAATGVRFDYFYSAQQMCSPGRFALLCGRNPFRTGLHHLGTMRPQEITLAQTLKKAGYRTALFGKWHLGPRETRPTRMGFDRAVWTDEAFNLGAKLKVGDTKETIELTGDSSVAVAGLAAEWVRDQAKGPDPFFAYVCFGSPHDPHRAADEFKALYKDLPEAKQHFWGEVSGVDAAVGLLRVELRKLGVAGNTVFWFTSDNGGITPASQDPAGKGKFYVGVRTQGLLEWPARFKKPIRTDLACGHVDLYPTTLAACGLALPDARPVDGVDLLPLLDRGTTERGKPLGFLLWGGHSFKAIGSGSLDAADFVADTEGVWLDGKYKLVVEPGGNRVAVYDVFADPAQKADLSGKLPDEVKRLRAALDDWRRNVRASYDGKDYPSKK